MEVSIKDIFRSKKLKKEILNNPLESGEDSSDESPEETGVNEAQEEFKTEEAQETTDDQEAQNELDSNADAKEVTEEETQDQTDKANENYVTPDNGEIDSENDLETTKNDDHISDEFSKDEKVKEGLSVIRKRQLVERIRKLKGK